MAASGGNIEWSTTVKPILTALYGPFFDKNDAVEIIQAIIKSESEFQNHEDVYDLFYTCFACLSAHFISVNANNLPIDQLSTARDAFRIILGQILKKLSEAGLSYDETSTTTAAPNVSIKQLLLPIVGLCGVDGGGYPQSDLVILTSLLKNAKLPAHVNVSETQTTKSSVIPSPITSLTSQTASNNEKQAPSTAQRRSDALLEQLTMPLRNPAASVPSTQVQPSAAVMSPGSKDSLESSKEANANQQPSVDMKKWVASTCGSLLMELRAGFIMLKVCSSLPCLQRYLNRWQMSKESANSPQFNSDASLLHFLVNEVNVCRLALSLPCLEPFTPDRIATLSDVATAWLLCATAQASLHPKDEESEQQTATLVESALSLYNTVGDTFRQSTRAGGYVYQNHLMIGAWVLLCGLHHALAGAPCPTTAPGKSPAKTPSRPYNLTKMQQGLGVVWVALGGRCLAWTGALLCDARLEALGGPEGGTAGPAPLHILDHHSAHERELRLAHAAPLHQLFVALGVVCYRKATNLKRAVVQKQHQDADPDRSDSTVYFQDMILCSEDSETDDEDSEPLFGLWFESTLVAPDAAEAAARPGADANDNVDVPARPHNIVPDKSEPYSYITLATEVFTLLNAEMMSEGAERLGSGALQLHEAHQALLAALAKDLDRETARTDTGTISSCFGTRLGGLYASFSAALVRYLHNLSGAPTFAALQPALHQQLAAAGAGAERANITPLQVGPRVVKLLGSMILSKSAAERENSILVMWHKIVNTLQECALQSQPSQDHDYEDLNVEHAQLLVYLFHSLTLMQKKSVLLMTSNAIIKVVETLAISDRKRAMSLAPHQLMLTTRLMLLLEYLMRHLYDAPQTLLQQIEWNLVIAPGLAEPTAESSTNGAKTTTDNGQIKSRIYCEVPYIEAAYRCYSQDESSMRPKFYALTSAEINNQENPKFDGLACNFVLGTPHKLKYPLLLDALLALLNAACVCDNPQHRAAPAALAAAHYCFQTAWRLVISMPPATPHMDKLQAGTKAELPSPLPLHAVIWAPRADNKKVFNPWLKDALVKQGMYTQYAENLLAGVSASCDNIKYTAWLASETIKHLKQNITSSGLPSLLDVISCDAALVRLKVCLADTTSAAEAHQFMPNLLDLLDTILDCCRLSAGAELENVLEAANDSSERAVNAARLAVCCAGGPTAATEGAPALCAWLRPHLPPATVAILERLATPPPLTCLNLAFYASHIIPSESAVLNLVSSHCELISGSSKYSIGTSLMMLAYSAAKLLDFGAPKLADNAALSKKAIDLIIPALADGRLEFLTEPLRATLNTLVPQTLTAEQLRHEHFLKTTYTVLVEHLQSSTEKTLRYMVKYWEKILERLAGRKAYEAVFSDDNEYSLGKILLTAPNARSPYTERVIKLFIKIFTCCDKSELNPTLCVSVCKSIGMADQQKLANLLSHICLTTTGSSTSNGTSGTANGTPTEAELATPTSSAPDGNPASLAFRNALRSVFRADSEPAQRSDTDLPVFDTPSPAPRAQSDTAQQSANSESCSWSDGSKDSAGAAVAEAAPAQLADAANDNATLLSALCKHIVTHCSEEVSERVLCALVSVCGEGCAPVLLRELCRLADAHAGADHRLLFPAAVGWLAACVDNLSSPDVLEKLEEGQIEGAVASQIESACVLLSYLSDALHAINTSPPQAWRSVSPSWESPYDVGFDLEYPDDQNDEEDTSADDSDEDAMLQYKLCTFTVTQREFMNQHWYHCHTCKMVDGVGVCTVCARVCHRGHDVSYAKFGNFFCDCGAKPDSSCQALVKRSVTLGGRSDDSPPASSLRRLPSSPTPPAYLAPSRRPAIAANIQGCRSYLVSYGAWGACMERVKKLLGVLAGPVRAACERGAAVGAHGRAQRALAQLHLGVKRFVHTDTLMLPTLGSQEGAFENVRMTYTGENGQTIRQLMSAHKLRRVAMCCLASPHGRRQHLAVSHEKGKITVLQLSALLKQADSSKHKLTLTRLSSAPIPFTVLSLSGNAWNEDLLAVCGLKECHVLTFNSGGAVADHLVLNTGLEGNNYVIKAIWLPGSQTQLALVTSDFVKIFDLSKDLNNPMHHFLVPSGKVRDVTFVNQEDVMHMLCMSSAGHIYWQPMSEESRATLGTFYVTNTLEVLHPEIQDVAGLVGGGGVSIYYSHTLKMLFFSYAQGKSFLAPLNTVEESVKRTAMITLSTTATQKEGGGRSGKQSGVQSLCQWAEVPGHPGLVTAVMQASNNPVVLMLTPTTIYVQEIKVVPAKAKITDMVAVRHWCGGGGGGEQKSTLILLCEDGSLRMYAASAEHTGYWLSPAIQPTHAPRRRPRAIAHNKNKSQQATAKSNTNGGPQFPIDFFEHCVAMTDIEFGGNDLLQVYNTAQIKNRLNTTSLYVVSTKMSGFSMEVINSDPNMVICGIRVLLGTQDVARTPSYVEVYGRTISTVVVRNRWFDIPLTREESLQSDKKLIINFGPSQDPDGVTMVDSVKVYGKNKEQFGWPEENEDASACPSTSKIAQEGDAMNGIWKPSSLERLACAALETLELAAGAPAVAAAAASSEAGAEAGAEAARKLLCAPASAHLHARAQCLLRAIYQSQYHQFKDQAILKYVCTALSDLRDTADARNIDPEAYFRLVLLARGVAVARPQHLVKFTPSTPRKPESGDWAALWKGDYTENKGESGTPHLCAMLCSVLWRLASVRAPPGPGGVLAHGLRHADHTLHALADILHAFQLHADNDAIDFGNQIYLALLLAEDQIISFGTKAALMRVLRPRIKRRRVYIPSPPNTPGAGSSVTTAPAASSTAEAAASESDVSTARDDQQENQFMDVDDALEPMVLLAPDGGLEALLDIPADADDETMVQLAIALSLQEQPRRAPPAPSAPPPPAPGFSDVAASPTGSDDEGSTAATDGSTLRTSPAEPPGSAGSAASAASASDSGGSGADSIGGVSGRSSAYGEMVSVPTTGTMAANAIIAAPVAMPAGPSTSSAQPVASSSRTAEAESEARKLHALRLSLLTAALDTLPTLRTLPGVRAIPFVQVVLMLAGDLDSTVEGDRVVLDRLLDLLVSELDIQNEEVGERGERRELQLAINRLEQLVSELEAPENAPPVHERTNRRELQLVIMRLLSVLMARWKTCGAGAGASVGGSANARAEVTGAAAAAHVSRLTAAALVRAGAPRHCYNVLAALLPYWKEKTTTTGTATPGQQLLKPQPPQPLPDMQPFFVKEYVKSHALDVFDNYPQLLMEMALRLPCQIHKHCDPANFDTRWRTLLCEYMMNPQTPLRKQVRKLLLLLCGTRERYRQLRDVHALDTHLNAARALLAAPDPAYDKLVQLMDHLKACAEIVSARTGNWQHTCATERRSALPWLLTVARRVHPHVAPTVLQLLQAALCLPTPAPAPTHSLTPPLPPHETKPSADWPERERSADSDAFVSDGSKFQEQKVPILVQQIIKQVNHDELRMFVKAFLLETNSTAVRWQAHALLLAIYNNSPQTEQASIVSLLWALWPTLPQYGRKSAQFVDLLGYFTLKTPNIETEKYLRSAVELLRRQNELLSSHGNAALYAALGTYVELDGYYLESEPCLVCNNPEVPMVTIKLPTIKMDSKFTTTTQIVKLVNSHTISRIALRISDIKRGKMVRAINFYYNNRTVQAVQELKNKPGMWHKAKRVQLQSGQSEVRVDFPLPIVACNLMMEYADFYENQQATGESLQCPRCSQSVPANPGVCANCGENVFQCHKCRAINYDEKDPFLCHACGFCKYAKFDYTLTAQPCCAVDTIESDEERKKMVQSIGALLDKADRVYRQLVANKPVLESLLHRISEHRLDRGADENSNAALSGVQINRVIQTVAQKYCVESKGYFEDLSKIIQKVLACRKELVTYDRSQSEQLKGETLPVYAGLVQTYDGDMTKESGGGCYGCSLASAEQCLTLLRALASQPEHRERLCRFGVVHELVHHNLHRGTPQCQEEVRALICLVTRDNLPATEQLCHLLSQRITLSLMGHAASQDHNNSVRPLVLLLGSLVKVQDSVDCWEARLRCIVKLWVWCCPQLTEVAGIAPAVTSLLKTEAISGIPGISSASPTSHQFALQQVALPCLGYLQQLMAPAAPAAATAPTDEQNKETKPEPAPPAPEAAAPLATSGGLVVDLAAWLAGRVAQRQWARLSARVAPLPPDVTLPLRDVHLARKYLAKWRDRVLLSHGMRPLALEDGGWLRPVMFDPSSRIARDTACAMVKSLCDSYERTKAVLILLTSFLPEVGTAGEASEQFLQLYQTLASEAPWKQFLALRGVLQQIADLMTKEIEQLHRLEETTLTSDLAQGYALKRLTELLSMFLEEGGGRRVYKGRLVGAVLGGYLSLRRLVVQRTRLTDDTQEKLLELLEEMTTGTEAETAEFMAVCIETVQKYPLHDYRTPVFIFERLCSIIYPEENDVGEFFLTLEKDPQQEDFLQGRMLGNPYSSLEPGMGPLMRDVKNKICTDCELVALLEDDNGMELLVCNKIMSLDLPVKDVYKKVWCTSGDGVDAMRVVYRMRGLLGDATEEFVETLSQTNAEAVDDEQLYRMANVLADCGGLEVMLQRLAAIQRVGGARALCSTLLRLLGLCARVRRCVRVLTRADTRALPVLLRALQLAAEEEKDMPRAHLVYQLLEIMERILSVAASESLVSFLQFSLTFGGPEYVQALINCTECPGIRNNSVALGHLTRVLAALVYGNDLKMAMLVDHFKPVLDFDRLDSEQWTEEEFRMELFCVLCANIERNSIGGTLKDYLISLGVVRDALEYIVKHAPCVKPTLVCTDSDELKEFISRPALKYILRFLTGLAADHEPTQMLVCEKVIPIVHRLEQVSSGEHVGSLAENLLEALRSQPQCAAKVQQVRDFTRQEKKRLAMAVRERQLGALGMRSNERGQVTAQCSLTQQLADLAEEAGAVCCICREGYKYQPTKVLGIYTFTKRCPVEEFEVRARKTLGYTTVSHYNIVHVECHMAAVRLARARDEWESAALQNASTRCNGLLPLWGPHVPESAFASCLARHTTYLQECTGHRDIGYTCTVHDLKLLLVRFARGRTFHDDTGGGGPLSNMQLVPALLHMALYVINTTRAAAREVGALEASLAWAPARLLEAAHDADGPLYYTTLMLLLYPHAKWQSLRVSILKRLLVTAHVRAVAPAGPAMRALPPEHRAPKPWADYKPYAIFFAIIDLLYTVMFKNVSATTVEQWPVKLAEYIRHNDEANAKAAERIVSTLTDELLPSASFGELCDAAGLLRDVPDPDAFLRTALEDLP
ncbi:PREDICTED: E3 ubiquitin-protein ligase UBR4 isoform X4 [Papilio xuthus]|uniref:E3 ubiquitin-protein ligase UBR4 isoform X4 n=1 Tax=Papilio xuthus TaxID=66420 RepID=A0AAJ6Z7F4_PAPXU|nr:PREDICTED: E3 ubiquitin-protein ligase UBR4 isoform X4 [Papilio xuthus]